MKGLIYYFTQPERACRTIISKNGIAGPLFIFFITCYFFLGSISKINFITILNLILPLFFVSFMLIILISGWFHAAFALQGIKGDIISLIQCFLTLFFPFIAFPLLNDAALMASSYGKLILLFAVVFVIMRGFYASLMVVYKVSKPRILITFFCPIVILGLTYIFVLSKLINI
jgi:hypothetical protein